MVIKITLSVQDPKHLSRTLGDTISGKLSLIVSQCAFIVLACSVASTWSSILILSGCHCNATIVSVSACYIDARTLTQFIPESNNLSISCDCWDTKNSKASLTPSPADIMIVASQAMGSGFSIFVVCEYPGRAARREQENPLVTCHCKSIVSPCPSAGMTPLTMRA